MDLGLRQAGLPQPALRGPVMVIPLNHTPAPPFLDVSDIRGGGWAGGEDGGSREEQPPHREEAGLPAFPGNRPFDLRQDS